MVSSEEQTLPLLPEAKIASAYEAAREWTELTDAAIQGERQRIEQCWRVIQNYRQKVGESTETQ